MNDDERAKILRMVAEGKLSPEEAADLLEAIQPAPTSGRREEETISGHGSGHASVSLVGRKRGRCLVIHVKEGGENKVNLRIPFTLTRAAGKFIPKQATNYLAKYEIDLQEFLDELGDAEGGTILEVREGDNKVLIAVE